MEDPGVNGRILLSWVFRKVGCEAIDWIDVAQDKDRWGALVNAAMKFRVS